MAPKREIRIGVEEALNVLRDLRDIQDANSRPIRAYELWLLLVARGRRSCTRAELIDEIGWPAYEISRATTDLVGVEVLTRSREPVPGQPGQGPVTYTLTKTIRSTSTK